MKKIYSLIIFGVIMLLSVPCLLFHKPLEVQAENKQVINNVIFVNFKNGDADWVLDTPASYTQNYYTLLDNAYNKSVSSVNNYYKAMSFNTLNLTSNFYFKNSSQKTAFTVPYTKEQLTYYSPTNPNGYLDYEVCTYSSASKPSFLSTTYFLHSVYLFGVYDCSNDNRTNSYNKHDYDTTDGIGCYCAYEDYASTHSRVALYDHWESYLREFISVKCVLSQLTSLSGNIDLLGSTINDGSDGCIDAISFVFPEAENVEWNDILWAHATTGMVTITGITEELALEYATYHGMRGETTSSVAHILKDYKVNNKNLHKYNLFTISDMVRSSKLTDANNNELGRSYVMAHELGHILGLPDLYAYNKDYLSNDIESVKYYDLMGGSISTVPTYLSTYHREKLGFLNQNNTRVLERKGTYKLKPVNYDELNNNNNNSNNILAYVLEDPNYIGQKIYIEYRKDAGNFETNYNNYYDGLIIYRIDENVTSSRSNNHTNAGNFYGYPYNFQIFQKNYVSTFNSALGSSYSGFGNSNLNSTTNAITFQTYSSWNTQDNLTYSDITYHNSGIVINNISINNQTGELSFSISGGYLADSVDFSQIKLNGSGSITHEVNTPYTDAGINFGEYFVENEFDIEITNINTNLLGEQTYKYKLTYKEDPTKVIELVRTVTLVDTTKPTVTLIGSSETFVTNIKKYVEKGINYSDNYSVQSDLTVVISDPVLNELTGKYVVTYTVTDKAGNCTTIFRNISIIEFDFSSVILNGEAETTHEAGYAYTDAGVNYGIYSSNDFETNITGEVNINELGQYTLTYSLTHKDSEIAFTLTRKVIVVDTTKPVITLIGQLTVEMTESEWENYKQQVLINPTNYYTVNDNFYTNVNVNIETSRIDNKGYVVFTAIDGSNNTSTLTQTILIGYKKIEKSQLSLKINGSTFTEKVFANKTVTIKLECNLVEGNNPNPEIKFYINNKQVDAKIENNVCYVEFTNEGIYNIKAVIGTTEITKQVVVADINDAGEVEEGTTITTILIIIGVLVVGAVILGLVISAANKIKRNLDKY